ncbi:MAG: DUF935 domain-containing protein [Desulfovibrio sp.]|jgi:phage gp29-like protein|nr:DUF935 domain-containing protein [Desulfovibrio sp.]
MSDKPHGIYLPNGKFLQFDAASLSTEIATRQNAGLDFAGISALWLNQLPDPDPILRKRGDDAVVLAELSADDQVTTAMLSRKNRVLNAPQYAFRPGAPDGEQPKPAAKKLYEELMRDLERTNLRTLISGILDAPFYGMTPLELLWSGAGGWWHLTDIVARPYHWFAFDTENRPFFRGEMGFAAAASDPKPLPPGKYVIVTHHATYDNPYGLRLLSRCLWPVVFKRGGLQFYAKFTERHGMPWVVGKAPKGVESKDKQDMAASMARMVRDCVAVIPAGSEVEFLAPGNTQHTLHEQFIARQDKAISKLLMGQTLTVEMEGRNNSQAAATTHEDVAEGLAASDKAMVADAMNEIAWLYARVNAGPDVLAPLFAFEEPEDLVGRADLDKKLYDMDVEFLPQHFEENYNLKPDEFAMRAKPAAPDPDPDADGEEGEPDPERDPKEKPDGPEEEADNEEKDKAGKEKKGEKPASFASAPGRKTEPAPSLAEDAQERLDAVVKRLLPDALKANGEFVTRLENAIKDAESFDAAELALVELLAPRTSPSALEDLLARAMTAAAGFGATAERSGIGKG